MFLEWVRGPAFGDDDECIFRDRQTVGFDKRTNIMSGITSQLLAMRQDIIAQNDVLKKAASASLEPGVAISRPPFSAAMASAIGDVSKQQDHAGDFTRDYTMGRTNDVAGVMLAKQKASLGFELTLQVRNKLIKAYQDIMTMPV